MSGYGHDFMGRVRGMWDRFANPPQNSGRRPQRPMQATGPGGEGYFISRDMARDANYAMDYRARGYDDAAGYGYPTGGMAQFGRAGAGRGYGGDFQTGRGGYDRGDFFVNRGGAGGTGYRPGYERAVGMRGYGADYTRGGSGGYDRGYRGGPAGYDRGFRGAPPPWTRGR